MFHRFSRNNDSGGRAALVIIVVLASIIALAYFFVQESSDSIVFGGGDGIEQKEVKKPPQHIATPSSVRAVYMTSWVAGTPSLRQNLVSFIDASEINSVVIDIKDYSGKISFKTDDPEIHAMQSEEERIPDIREFIETLHQKNIYVIGRISVFQDPWVAKRHPELAVADVRGGLWRDRKGIAYIDPGAQKHWQYTVRIAQAAERVGFDELNFDYIRFPSDGQLSRAVYPHSKKREKAAVMEDFFTYLAGELKTLPIATSADLFGLTTINKDDLGIGQVLERAAPYFTYIAPMVYPSHYDSGFHNFKKPAEHPYEVVSASVTQAFERLKAMGQDPNKLRPWIQDFDLGAPYGAPEIHAQIKAISDAGLTSWMVWDPSNRYTKEAYNKE